MNIDSGSAEAEARDRLAVIGFAEVERRLVAAREDVARMRKQIADHEEAEASVCPEDVGFVEFIGVLQKRIEQLKAALIGVTPSYRVKGKCWCPHWLDLRSGHSDECKAARAAIDSARAAQPQAPGEPTANQAFLDAFSERDDWTVGLSREQVRLIRERLAPTPGATDGERIDAVERLKLHVQYRDGSPPSVEKWAARNDAGMWTGSTAREAIDKALAAVRAERGGK